MCVLLLRTRFPDLASLVPRASPAGVALLRKLFIYDINQRASAAQALADPFFAHYAAQDRGPTAQALIEEPPTMDMAQLHQAVAAELQLVRTGMHHTHEDTTVAPTFDLNAVAGGAADQLTGGAVAPSGSPDRGSSSSSSSSSGGGGNGWATGSPSISLEDGVLRDEINSMPPNPAGSASGGMDVS